MNFSSFALLDSNRERKGSHLRKRCRSFELGFVLRY